MKILFLGNSGVGKTLYLNLITGKSIKNWKYHPTSNYNIVINNNIEYWDISGTNFLENYLDNTDYCFIFNHGNIDYWLSICIKYKLNYSLIQPIINNKLFF